MRGLDIGGKIARGGAVEETLTIVVLGRPFFTSANFETDSDSEKFRDRKNTIYANVFHFQNAEKKKRIFLKLETDSPI